MNWFGVLLSMVPGIEARGAGLYLACLGHHALIPFAILLNFISAAAFVMLLDSGRVPERVETLLERRSKKLAKRIESFFSRYGNVAIFLLIALPSTGVGSYTGAFIGRVFGLRNRLLYLSLFAGICVSVVAGILVAYAFGSIGFLCG